MPVCQHAHAKTDQAPTLRTIGLIGGMSWQSTIEYYQFINEGIRDRLGGLNSAPCVLYSFNFEEIEALQRASDWDGATQRMIDAARAVEAAGAECVLICTNTMHLMADAVAGAINIPLLHIADATAARIRAAGLRQVALLGTHYTMEKPFYRDRLTRHGLEVIVPDAADRDCVHDVIFGELCRGVVSDTSRARYRAIIGRLVAAGAEGVVLGCTEIDLLLRQDDSPVPLFDTTRIHASAAVDFTLSASVHVVPSRVQRDRGSSLTKQRQ